MAPKQRMRIANEKASKLITMRGNVPKSSVSTNKNNIFFKIYLTLYCHLIFVILL